MRTILIAIIALLIAGCSGHAYVQDVTTAGNTNLAPYDSVYVEVKAEDGSIESREGFDISKTDFEKAFIADMTERNRFGYVGPRITGKPERGAVVVSLVIEDLNYVSGASSAMFGVMAGNARFKVLARIMDAESGELIAEVRSGAHTRSSGGIFRGSTGTLIVEVSKQLATKISSYK